MEFLLAEPRPLTTRVKLVGAGGGGGDFEPGDPAALDRALGFPIGRHERIILATFGSSVNANRMPPELLKVHLGTLARK